MKAAVYTQYGPPEVVQITEVPLPKLQANSICVRVCYSTVNRTDCGFRSAQHVISRLFSGLFKPRCKILGCEFSGEVVSIGSKVSTFKVGDRVFGYDDTYFGGHAEYKVISSLAAVAPMPAGLDYAQAACLLEGSHYALCQIRSARVQPGHTVLVYGASGAIGSAAVQLLKHMGAYVVGVSDQAGIQSIKDLGADVLIDYTQQDFKSTKQKFDFILDAVGKLSFRICKPLLKYKGIYISTELGKGFENILLSLSTHLSKKKKVLFPIPTIKQEDVFYLRRLAETAAFRPLMDRSYTLDQIVEAYTYVETGQKKGNVLLKLTQSR